MYPHSHFYDAVNPVLQCIGQNYARNEASYFLVRLLQEFDTFSLAPEAQPHGSLPPPSWKEGRGRERIEKIWPAYAMTLFVKVSSICGYTCPFVHSSRHS